MKKKKFKSWKPWQWLGIGVLIAILLSMSVLQIMAIAIIFALFGVGYAGIRRWSSAH
ncbi:MAG: hypothetical protein ACE5H1_01205 [Thermodesulfobacteriota bacterium]